MRKTLDKFLLLMWKNWKLQYRRPLQTTIEILAPVLFSILLVMLRSLVEPVENPEVHYYPYHPVPQIFFFNAVNKNGGGSFKSLFHDYTVVYSPSPNKILDHAMGFLKPTFKNIKGYKNAKMLEHHFLTPEAPNTLAGIQFDDALYNASVLPKKLEVTLR